MSDLPWPLSCLDFLDQGQMGRDYMSAEQRAADARIYGIDCDVLEGTGPAVVSLNGVMVPLVVIEFMGLVTGIREPAAHLIYRGDLTWLTKSLDQSREGCWYWHVAVGDEEVHGGQSLAEAVAGARTWQGDS